MDKFLTYTFLTSVIFAALVFYGIFPNTTQAQFNNQDITDFEEATGISQVPDFVETAYRTRSRANDMYQATQNIANNAGDDNVLQALALHIGRQIQGKLQQMDTILFETYALYSTGDIETARSSIRGITPLMQDINELYAPLARRDIDTGITGLGSEPSQQDLDDANSGETLSCNSFLHFSFEHCIKLGVSSIFFMVLYIAGYGMGLAGLILDSSVTHTIIEIRNNLGSADSIKTAWDAVRNLANLSLIFILVYIAIDTILQTGRVNTGKSLRQVIIVALLINFSFFFTEVIIDISNVLALSFYDLAHNVSGTSQSISVSIANNLGVSSVLEAPDTIAAFARKEWISLAAWGIGGVIIFGVTGFVMLAIAFLLIVRYIVFVFVLVTASAAFAFSILPSTSEYSKKWWNALINQSIVAPVMFLFLWVALKVMGDPSFLDTADGGISGVFSISDEQARGISTVGGGSSVPGLGSLINFLIVIGLLIGAILASVSIGVAGSKYVSKMGKKLNDTVGTGFAKRTGGASLRGTVGRAGLAAENKLSESRIGNLAPVRAFRKATTGAAAKAKFGTKIDSKKAAEERGGIIEAKGMAISSDIKKKEEAYENKLKEKSPSYKSELDYTKQYEEKLEKEEKELKELQEKRSGEKDPATQRSLDFQIKQRQMETDIAKKALDTQKNRAQESRKRALGENKDLAGKIKKVENKKQAIVGAQKPDVDSSAIKRAWYSARNALNLDGMEVQQKAKEQLKFIEEKMASNPEMSAAKASQGVRKDLGDKKKKKKLQDAIADIENKGSQDSKKDKDKDEDK